MNLTASVIWRYVEPRRSFASIVDALAFGFADGCDKRSTVEKDVAHILNKLEEFGLIKEAKSDEVKPGGKHHAVVTEYGFDQMQTAYKRPTLQLYTFEQMQQEFGNRSGDTTVLFSDTWNPT